MDFPTLMAIILVAMALPLVGIMFAASQADAEIDAMSDQEFMKEFGSSPTANEEMY